VILADSTQAVKGSYNLVAVFTFPGAYE